MGGQGVEVARAAGAGRLLERERELASLDALISGTADGDGRVALVEGPAGIGKTRLLGETRRRAEEAGLRVLHARGGELEREFAFGVVHQLLGPVVGEPGAFDGGAAPANAVFERVDHVAGEDVSFAVLHGLYWLTLNVSAERPLLLAVDDLHWCDRASLRFLAYLVRRLEGVPVLVACGLRSSEPGVDTALLGEITSDPRTVSVHPGPLGGDSVAELVRRRLGDDAQDAFAAACHTATGGNPLLLNELLKALDAERVAPTRASIETVRQLGPRAASRAVLLRLARLPADAADVARAVAVLGDGADLACVAALAELDETGAAAAMRELVRAEMIRPEPPLGFVHPLVRAAVYRDVPPGERELLHGRAARLLADAGGSEEHVAAQMIEMPRRGDDWVVDTLVSAAKAATSRGAAESAVAYLRRALDEPPAPERRVDLLLQLGAAEGLTDGVAAAEHLGAAYEMLDDPVARAEVAIHLVSILVFTHRGAEAHALARDAIAGLGDQRPDLVRFIESGRITLAHFDLASSPIDDPAFARYRGELAGPDLGARSLAAAAAYQWAMTGATADEAVALATRALEDGSLVAGTGAGGPTMGAVIVLALADRPEALEWCDAVLESAHRRGSAFEASGGYLFRGHSLLLRGALAEAEDALVEATELTRAWGSIAVTLYPASYLCETLLERGDLGGARAVLEQADLYFDPPSTNIAWWFAAKLKLGVAAGEHEEVLALADRCEALLGDVIVTPAWVPWRSLRAESLHALGRTDEAIEHARRELELSRHWGAPRTLGRSLRVLGSITGAEGVPLLEEAVAVLDGSIARLEHAKALSALGTALRHARRPADAREPLRRSLDLATACDATPLAEHVRSELYATGARPRTTALEGVGSLTASERRVASLAAEGATNRDIAQALFVTPKTVEVHLSNTYRKLGIRSRRDLAAALS